MPKMKSHSSFKKRVKVTRNGKVLFHKTGRRHLMKSKSAGAKRAKRLEGRLSKPQEKIVHQLLPYA